MRVAYLIGFFIVSIGVVLYLFQLDDELSDESKAMIAAVEARAAPAGALEPYYFLYGISAPEQVDPVTRGREDLAQFEQSGAAPERADKLPLPSPGAPLHCRQTAPDCFKQLIAQRDQWDKALSAQRVLLERYETYLNYDDFVTPPSTASMQFVIPGYQYLIRANELKVVSALKAAQEQGADAGVAILLSDLRRLRAHLMHADSLIQKMIMVAMIANTLDAVVKLDQQFEPNQVSAFEPLIEAERNLDQVLAFEFYFMYRSYLSFDRSPEAFGIAGKAPGWAVRIVYKPNRTTNRVRQQYAGVIRFSRLDAKQFSDQIDLTELRPAEFETMSDRILNFVGSTVSQISNPDLNPYIARLHDLNIKFILANHILSKQEGLPANPYGQQYGVQQSEHSLCMDGPLKDERGLRCISWQ